MTQPLAQLSPEPERPETSTLPADDDGDGATDPLAEGMAPPEQSRDIGGTDTNAAQPEPDAPLAEDTALAELPPALPEVADPASPDTPAAMADTTSPAMPVPMLRPAPSGLPGAPVPPRDTPLPQSPTPPEQAAMPEPNLDTAPDAEPEPTLANPLETAPPSLPGTRVTGLPGTPTTRPAEADQSETEQADAAPNTALERNSSFDGQLTGGPLMAIILNDPGLPTPLRRSLAALELPVTIALNPMDPSASQGAEIYREAGKEVLILANGLPAGARASDLDVTFGAWFDSLPQAVGVLDLPRGGFARNAALTSGVLPLIARDGHGLVSFAGGLSRMDSAAQAAGVPHAEVFRVLDDEDQSPFTIRRYLDRAVFQASQIGEVLVFGDAANDATMEALELWRSDGRADQVVVVPVSAILLTR
jgi:polysaccharide deacetylase 2 family uncharacterized protein YibQ